MKKILSYSFSIVVAIIAIYFLTPVIDQYKSTQQYNFNVSSLNSPLTQESFKGKVLAIYFGYMYCPDVCPTSLSSLSQALKQFPKEKTDEFKGLFISVDPDRDNLKDLDDYAKYFHPNFLGATSNKENIDDIVKRFGSFYSKVYLENSKMDYSVSHTSYIYIFDKQGKFVQRIDHFSDPKAIKAVLDTVL
jgi:protein SCO1/2